jgi:rod shape determining protein RodA
MRRNISILQSIDWVTVGMVALLAIIGWLNITSASSGDGTIEWFDLGSKGGKQLLFMGVCSVLAAIILSIEGEFFIRTSAIYYVATLLLLAGVLVIGKQIGGARSWYSLGSFSIQPAEFAKSGTALFLAWLLSRGNRKLRDGRTKLQSIVLVTLPVGLIMLQPDAGTALVFGGFVFALYREGLSGQVLVVGVAALVLAIATILTGAAVVDYPELGPASGIFAMWAVLFSGGVLAALIIHSGTVPRQRKRVRRVGSAVLVASLAFSAGLHTGMEQVLKPHQRERIHVLFGIDVSNPDADYNIRHAKAAVGSGQWTGKGFNEGPMTAFGFVPEQETDFIFCTVGEEWGFVGSVLVVLLFLALMLRILYIAERQRSDFTRVYAHGVAAILFMHFTINVGMVLGLAPVIGIPLPFFSYGGSSLLGFTVLIFVLLRLDAERYSVLR